MTIDNILLIVFAVITVLVVLFAVIFGFRRNFVQTIIRLIVLAGVVVASAFVAVTYSKTLFEAALDYANSAEANASNDILAYLASGTDAAEKLKSIGESAFAPMIFFAVFIVLNLVTFLLYAIIGAFTFSQGHKKRKARRNGDEYRVGKGFRIACLVLNLVIAFSLASFILIPVTYYAPLVEEVIPLYDQMNASNQQEEQVDPEGEIGKSSYAFGEGNDYYVLTDTQSDDLSQLGDLDFEEILEKVNSSMLVKLYSPVGGIVSGGITQLKAGDNQTNVKDLVANLVNVLSDVISVQDGDITSGKIYNIAKSAATDKYLDELLGGLIADACTAWSKGETFLGVSPIDGIPTSVYTALKDQKTASEAIKAFGHAYAFMSIMNYSSSDANSTASAADTVKELTENLSPESVETIKSVVNDVLTEQLGEENSNLAPVISSTISTMLDGLLEVKTSGDAEKLEKETEAISTVFEIVNKGDDMSENDIGDLIQAVNNSEVIKDSLEKVAEEGSNILNVELTTSQEESVYKTLKDNGVEEGDDVYKIVTSILGLGDSDGEGNGESNSESNGEESGENTGDENNNADENKDGD
jgi:hypothetical protein